MKKFLVLILSMGFFVSALGFVSAVDNNFEIIPQAKDPNVGADVTEVGKAGGSVRDKLNQKAAHYESGGDIGAQFASGAFTWNTILNYVVYLVRFLSQIALVIGAAMIVVAGYKYAMAAFKGSVDATGKKDIENAIIGVLIVIFSYALIKILTAAFL